MIKKIENVIGYFLNNWVKIYIIVCIVASILFYLFLTITGSWNKIFYFPEENKYETLKQEVRDIILSEDYTREGYLFTTNDYNFTTKTGVINVSKNEILINTIVKNGEIEIQMANKYHNIIMVVCIILLPILIISGLVSLALVIIIVFRGIRNVKYLISDIKS